VAIGADAAPAIEALYLAGEQLRRVASAPTGDAAASTAGAQALTPPGPTADKTALDEADDDATLDDAARTEVMPAAAHDDGDVPESPFDDLTASPVRLMNKIIDVRVVADERTAPPMQGTGRAADRRGPPDLTIYGDGQGGYRVGASEPVCVSKEEDMILQAFSAYPTMDTAKLKAKSKMRDADVSRVVRGLREKYGGLFKPAIRCPVKKGQGGYHAVVKFIDTRP
jgi:hypothetical protein